MGRLSGAHPEGKAGGWYLVHTMKLSNNTVLITGGGSGIGRALAEAFHAAGSKVVIAGRRRSALDEVAKGHPGISTVALDIEDGPAIPSFVETLLGEHPALNVVIHNAGIMRLENLRSAPAPLSDAETTIATNLLGPIRLTSALLPHLLKQESAAILTVTSGLAFTPLAGFPTYCATKAALHSYSESLRYQLRDTRVEVIEVAPPYVQTELTGAHQLTDPHAMPLAEFIKETMTLLSSSPTPKEILVERVKPLRFSAKGDYDAFYEGLNGHFSAV